MYKCNTDDPAAVNARENTSGESNTVSLISLRSQSLSVSISSIVVAASHYVLSVFEYSIPSARKLNARTKERRRIVADRIPVRGILQKLFASQKLRFCASCMYEPAKKFSVLIFLQKVSSRVFACEAWSNACI